MMWRRIHSQWTDFAPKSIVRERFPDAHLLLEGNFFWLFCILSLRNFSKLTFAIVIIVLIFWLLRFPLFCFVLFVLFWPKCDCWVVQRTALPISSAENDHWRNPQSTGKSLSHLSERESFIAFCRVCKMKKYKKKTWLFMWDRELK